MDDHLLRKLGQAKSASRLSGRQAQKRFAEPSAAEVRQTLARRGIVFDDNGDRITDPVALKAAIKSILGQNK